MRLRERLRTTNKRLLHLDFSGCFLYYIINLFSLYNLHYYNIWCSQTVDYFTSSLSTIPRLFADYFGELADYSAKLVDYWTGRFTHRNGATAGNTAARLRNGRGAGRRQWAKSAVHRRAAGLLNNKTNAGTAALNCKTRCNAPKTRYN